MIAIFAAMESEVRACLPAFGVTEHRPLGAFPTIHGEGVVIRQTGLGRSARAAAKSLLGEITPRAVLSIGTAGGLAPGLGVGDVVFCERITHSFEPGSVAGHDGLLEIALATAADVGLPGRRGRSVTVDTVAWGPEQKAALHANGAPDITEMESFWIGQAAAENSLPYLAIRSVSDDANNRLIDIPGLFDEHGRVDAQSVLAFTRAHPEVIPELAAQHERGGIALASISRFLIAFLPRLQRALV